MAKNDMRVTINMSGTGMSLLSHIRSICVYRELKRQREVLNLGTTTLRIHACSSGALAAIMAVAFTDHNDAISCVSQLYNRCFAPGYLCTHIPDILNRMLPLDAHHIASSYLSIGVCTFNPYTGANESTRVEKFETRAKLIETIVDSCTIPFITGWPRIVDGYKYRWDGMFIRTEPDVVGTPTRPAITIVSGVERVSRSIYPYANEFNVTDIDRHYKWAAAYIETMKLDITGRVCPTQLIDTRTNTDRLARLIEWLLRWTACSRTLQWLYRACVSFLVRIQIVSPVPIQNVSI